jgi:hypothetical protein
MAKITNDDDDGLKLAYVFWDRVGRPKAFAKRRVLEAWSLRMEKLMSKVSLPYSEFRWFIVWCTRQRDADGANYGNDFTATYLRSAKDPMLTLEKNFAQIYYEFFIPKADKVIGYLRDKVQREKDARSVHKSSPRLTWYDVIVDKHNPQPWQVEKARWSTLMDERFPMLFPAPGESMEQFVDRMFAPYAAWRDWRCSKCEYGIGDDGDVDERVKWCGDCHEEISMNIADDMELLEEVPVVSDITREWT